LSRWPGGRQGALSFPAASRVSISELLGRRGLRTHNFEKHCRVIVVSNVPAIAVSHAVPRSSGAVQGVTELRRDYKEPAHIVVGDMIVDAECGKIERLLAVLMSIACHNVRHFAPHVHIAHGVAEN
jgi:hypothetical protein